MISQFISNIFLFCLIAITTVSNAWPDDFKCINPKGNVFPLNVYDIELGSTKSIELDLPQINNNEIAYLFLEIADVDQLREMQVSLNDNTLKIPDSIINDTDNAFAYLAISTKNLKIGKNIISFAFMDNLNNTTRGYFVKKVQIWIADKEREDMLCEMLNEKTIKPVIIRNADKEDYYSYFDNFSEVDAGHIPQYWMKVEGKSAVVVQSEDENYLRLDGAESRTTSTVHLFSNHTGFSAKVKCDNITEDGGIWIGVRFNLQNAFVIKCGYDFKSSQWMIKDYYNHKLWIHKAVESKFDAGKWYNLKIEALGGLVRFYVDDKLMCDSNSIRNINYGKIMLEADGIIADFDDLSYRGTGRPQDGVLTFYLEGANGDMVTLDNGDIILQYSGKHRFMRSVDNGITWAPDSVFLSATKGWGLFGNLWRLKSGKLLHIFQYLKSGHPNWALRAGAEISTDSGVRWDGPYWIHPSEGDYCTMNGKITQVENGRIFFVSAVGGEGAKYEDVGGLGIWYSDNDGISWHESQNRLNLATTGYNLQEGEIVELSNGNLVLLSRSNTGFLMMSMSDNNGLSWSTDIKATPLVSTMCAFNTFRDVSTGEIFVFWTYDDTSECPEIAQKPRERISLARSVDDMMNWQYLADVDDFGGHPFRFMNLGMYVDDECVYTLVIVFDTKIGTGRHALEVTRFERSKLKPYNKFPTLH